MQEAKIDLLMKMIQTMCARIEKFEACHTGDRFDRRIEEQVEKKVAETFEEARERLNIIVSN